jgi:hypothetical protein
MDFVVDMPGSAPEPDATSDVLSSGRERVSQIRVGSWPVHGWIGLGLMIAFWLLNWSLPGLRTHWFFFPLWLGYCLTVDALVVYRKGTSMLTRSLGGYILLFLISAPGWWLFELLNLWTRNWSYLGVQDFTYLGYFLLCTLSFSTVMPAVLGTAELVSTFRWPRVVGRARGFTLTRGTLLVVFFAGWLMLALLLLWPRYFFPFLWLSVYFILDPVNVWLGKPSLLRYVANGNWRPVLALALGSLICGWFWEMWNFRSYPRWVYHVPFVDFWRVFEMPLLGYLGYIPFSWELFALYHLMSGWVGRADRFVQID